MRTSIASAGSMEPRNDALPARYPVPPGEGGLATLLMTLGFSCTRCGECCRGESGEDHLVLVAPHEVREIARSAGARWEDVAEPFPCFIRHGEAGSHTFEWCLRREGNSCRFLGEAGGCGIYSSRPWICRTYPFVLDEGDLLVFPCPGLGTGLTPAEAEVLAAELSARERFEREEEDRIRSVLARAPLPQERVVIDGEGVKVLSWVR
jgi:Fe-S-cluster containining protein